jgi:N-carbamoylputrescine amidase
MTGIGLVQLEPVLGDLAGNRQRSVEGIHAAASKGADLIVLPELSSSGYNFAGRAEATCNAEWVPGPTTDAWTEAARDTGTYVVGGVCEQDGDDLFNTAALVGPDGLIGIYRKLHLFDREQLSFRPGNRGLPVFSLPFGRVGMVICYDLRFVETTRILSTQGADLIAVPTNWVPTLKPEGEWDEAGFSPQGRLTTALSSLNGVFIAAADRVGEERGLRYLGASLLTSPDGDVLLGPLPKAEPAVAVCEVDFAEVQKARVRSERIAPFRERRTDVYGQHLGYEPQKWDQSTTAERAEVVSGLGK